MRFVIRAKRIRCHCAEHARVTGYFAQSVAKYRAARLKFCDSGHILAASHARYLIY